jgi:hypothetical protein
MVLVLWKECERYVEEFAAERGRFLFECRDRPRGFSLKYEECLAASAKHSSICCPEQALDGELFSRK